VIRGVGVDIVSVPRLSALVERYGERATGRLFTRGELADCERRAAPADCLAGRFAAKEAFLKALGTGLASGVRWGDMAIRSDQRGRPELLLTGKARERLREVGGDGVHVSLSHDAGVAVAVVIIEGDSAPMA
jgi:holo-[acyl-carrier protein] synthase